VGLYSAGFEIMTEVLNHKIVQRTAMLGVDKKGQKNTVELNVEFSRK
jgi:hypothetical protein